MYQAPFAFGVHDDVELFVFMDGYVVSSECPNQQWYCQYEEVRLGDAEPNDDGG